MRGRRRINDTAAYHTDPVDHNMQSIVVLQQLQGSGLRQNKLEVWKRGISLLLLNVYKMHPEEKLPRDIFPIRQLCKDLGLIFARRKGRKTQFALVEEV